ncbi:unnamed protein product [Acanthoscelides obtectus]|uniref:Uncharacterized protein n=1 Tax=Acanthoscelides obtectus TaxID=200917 RepID=A0A9P0K6J4_ACAOB|nr:unnamed protein product [Acanthoscelides obtectus]CAK1633175.1 hypothetical protein AOBTE_LOCUS7980 [Acanthoscelides obtectus]
MQRILSSVVIGNIVRCRQGSGSWYGLAPVRLPAKDVVQRLRSRTADMASAQMMMVIAIAGASQDFVKPPAVWRRNEASGMRQET